MKVKKYDSYLREGRDDYEDEYYDQYGYGDDEDYPQGQEEEDDDPDMEHLLYLLRKYLRDGGAKDVSVRNSSSSIKVEIVMKREENLSDVIKLFGTLRRLSDDIMADYDSEFDIWETKKGDPLLIIDYYSPDEDDDEDGAPF
jgi:hypothetical protein